MQSQEDAPEENPEEESDVPSSSSGSSENDSGHPETSMSMISMAQRGDQAAWNRLIEIYAPLVHLQCIRKGLQIHDAHDVTMTVFTALWEGLHRFTRDKKNQRFLKYLRKITSHKLADHYRATGRRPDIAIGGDAQLLAALDQPVGTPLSDIHSELLWAEEKLNEDLRAQHMVVAKTAFNDEFYQAWHRTVIDEASIVVVAKELDLLPPEVDWKASIVATWMRHRMTEFEDAENDQATISRTYATISQEEQSLLDLLAKKFQPQAIAIYRLKEVYGMPIASVAAELNVTQAVVRTSASRVRKWVRKEAPDVLASLPESLKRT